MAKNSPTNERKSKSIVDTLDLTPGYMGCRRPFVKYSLGENKYARLDLDWGSVKSLRTNIFDEWKKDVILLYNEIENRAPKFKFGDEKNFFLINDKRISLITEGDIFKYLDLPCPFKLSSAQNAFIVTHQKIPKRFGYNANSLSRVYKEAPFVNGNLEFLRYGTAQFP